MTKKVDLNIKGMHCGSCEVLLERKLKDLPGVESVKANHSSGKITLVSSKDLDVNEINNAIKEHGYSVESVLEKIDVTEEKSKKQKISHYEIKRDHFELGAVFLIIVALYLILNQYDLIPKNLGVTDNMSYGFVFVLGLVAAMSTCLAVTGGLLLTVAAKYNPNVSGYKKFKPHIYFNIGRIISYTLLGGLVGALGSLFILSPKTSSYLTIAASVVMIILGIDMLGIFPGIKKFQPKIPKFISHKLHDSIEKHPKSAPFFFGGSTFFLPCGFTQALQLYVLSQGSFLVGALTMFFFSLGTMPALVSIGAISSFAKGNFQRYFIKFTAVLVIILGVISIQGGFTFTTANSLPTNSDTAQLIGDVQVIDMKVNGLDYYPNSFTLKKGVPVEWNIDGRNAQGCAQIISAPNLGITRRLDRNSVTKITFTPTKTGKIVFSCSMGMAGPGVFNVL